MKRILLIATGGTIASKPTGEGLAPGIESRELLECVPEAADIGRIEARLDQGVFHERFVVCADLLFKARLRYFIKR